MAYYPGPNPCLFQAAHCPLLIHKYYRSQTQFTLEVPLMPKGTEISGSNSSELFVNTLNSVGRKEGNVIRGEGVEDANMSNSE